MCIRQVTDYRGHNGLEQGKEGAESSAEENDVIARVDGAGEGVLVGIQVMEDAIEEGIWRWVLSTIEGQ